ncbi:MAG: purine-nucleoside phosphorylase [Eubacteriales bacterium]|nr:purine-nucleoside phosphorylase [Eubacteriales bacterium]MDD4323405.1 purine-nucleoside phosphorylase [Eubacteriales bacterium]MDD4540721.1 purine-nucleoside phosphorylase [Eubacteriales bacterium]
MSTPHNSAKKGDIAKTVLMPGDPLRAKFIAENFLDNPVKFNEVRGMLGYTGTYKGKPVSVMGSGMGQPSIGIYSYELYTEYDVDNIIRVGSCGAYDERLDLFDVILVTDAYSDTTYAKMQSGYDKKVLEASPELTEKLRQSAKELELPVFEGRTYSSDVFYYEATPEGERPLWEILHEDHDCLCVEMESFALFHNAKVTDKQGACLLTVSDTIYESRETTPEQREKSFTNMMEIALGIL